MVTDVQDEAGEQTTADIRDTGADALYVHLDEAGWQAVDRVVVYEDVEPAALGEHAAKGSVRTLTKNATLHWATEGVRLNSVHPGFIRTPILDQAKGTGVWDSMTAMTPMDAWASLTRSRLQSRTSQATTRRSSPGWSSTSTAATSRADDPHGASNVGSSTCVTDAPRRAGVRAGPARAPRARPAPRLLPEGGIPLLLLPGRAA